MIENSDAAEIELTVTDLHELHDGVSRIRAEP
jgi:hypothetical protein